MSSFLNKNKRPVGFSNSRISLPAPLYRLAPTDFIEPAGMIDPVSTPSTRSICLTFDDGPDAVYTPKILAVLADYDVKATFFVLGEAASQLPHLVEQITKAGHALGNHTFSHRHPWLMSAARARQEVIQTNKTIKDIVGVTPRWFRPPFGRLRPAMRMQAQMAQMTTVLWSRSVMDWGVFGTKTDVSRRLQHITPGDIVLLHDGRPRHNCPDITYQCLPQFLRTLSDKSLLAQSLDDVFAVEVPLANKS